MPLINGCVLSIHCSLFTFISALVYSKTIRTQEPTNRILVFFTNETDGETKSVHKICSKCFELSRLQHFWSVNWIKVYLSSIKHGTITPNHPINILLFPTSRPSLKFNRIHFDHSSIRLICCSTFHKWRKKKIQLKLFPTIECVPFGRKLFFPTPNECRSGLNFTLHIVPFRSGNVGGNMYSWKYSHR